MGLMVEKFVVAARLKNSWSTATMKLVVAVAVDSPDCWSGEFPRAVPCVCKSIRMREPNGVCTSIRCGVYRLPHTISAVPVCPQSCEPIHSRSLQDSAGGDNGKRKRITRHLPGTSTITDDFSCLISCKEAAAATLPSLEEDCSQNALRYG